MPLISIQVTPDIAAKIRFLAESGVFAVKTGNVSLAFKEGHLGTIKTELFTYSPKLSPEQIVDEVDIKILSPIV